MRRDISTNRARPRPPNFGREIEICGLILAWYGSSTMILICFKSLTSRPDLEFAYGSGTTLFVNLLAFLGTSVIAALARSTCSERASLPPRVGLLDARVAPIGVLAGVELVLGNLALVQLSMTFRTMLHACTPCLMLFAGVAFGVEEPTGRAVLAVLFLTAGGVLSGIAEGHDFRARGFGIQLMASTIATVRWVLIQKFFQQEARGTDTDPRHPLKVLEVTRVTSMYVALVALAMTCVLEPAALGPVGLALGADPEACGSLGRHWPVIAAYIFLAASGVCLLMWSEMRLTALTSALTVSVAAALHNVPIIAAGMYAFNERLNLTHVWSLFLILLGTGLYVAIRSEKPPLADKSEKPLLVQVEDDEDDSPLLAWKA